MHKLVYRLDDDITKTCSVNADLALKVNRPDLVQMWSLLALSVPLAANPSRDPNVQPWASHPFGREMLKSLQVASWTMIMLPVCLVFKIIAKLILI